MRYPLLFALLVLPLTMVAGDGFLSRFAFRPDTVYVVRPPYRFAIQPDVSTSFGELTTRWGEAEDLQAYTIMSAPMFKVGCQFTAYGLTAGIHRDVKRLLHFYETEETEYSFGGYTPRLGGDLSYSSSKTHTLNGSTEGTPWSIPFEGCHTRRFHANGYIVFDPHRFSLPAAITQRHKQLRSAGSIIACASLTGFRMDVDAAAIPPTLIATIGSYEYANHIIYTAINMAAGYAYNWVVSSQWMLHASYLQALSIHHYGELSTSSATQPIGNEQNFGGHLRLSAVWDDDRLFGGFTGTMHMQWMNHTPLYIYDYYVQTRLFFGFRF